MATIAFKLNELQIIIRGCIEHAFQLVLLFLQNSKLEFESDLTEDRKGLKQKATMVAQCLERKEEKARTRARKHRSLICLDDMGADVLDLPQRPYKECKSPKKNEIKTGQTHQESDKQLPANVIQELNSVLQKHRIVHENT